MNVRPRAFRRIGIVIGIVLSAAIVASPAAAQALDINIKNKPSPPEIGENVFKVTVRTPDGADVDDAEVSMKLRLKGAPARSPDAMREVKLTHLGNGAYRVIENIEKPGTWDITVQVKRGGQEVGRKQLTLTAAR